MNKLIIKVLIAIIVVLTIAGGLYKIKSLKEENARLKSNQEILLTENRLIIAESQKYKVSDSLNAIKVSEFEFTLKEYKRYRSEDLKLIEQLEVGKLDLEKIITSQSETIGILSIKLNDSIKIGTVASQIDTLKCFNYKSKWIDAKGCINLKKDTIELQINNREVLKVVETITYKRFLGFLWKTNKVKSRQVDIVSENPNTEIVNCEYISIKQ